VAIFGRRQPHAPLILRGLTPAQVPIGRVLVTGQRTAQHAADRFFRRSFAPKVIRGGGQPAVARSLVSGQKTAQHAADRTFRRSFPPIVRRAGPLPSVGRLSIAGQKTSQAAADRFFRRSFPPIIRRTGPPPSVNGVRVFGQRTAQHAADRYFRRSFPPLMRTAGRGPAVARALVLQQQAQLAVRRPRYNITILPPRVVAAPVTPQKGVVVFAGQKTSQAAADRFFRRSFPPIVRKPGSPPALARSLAVQRLAQTAALRPFRRSVFISPAPPAPAVSTRPIGKVLLFGQKAGQFTVDRYFRRALVPLVKRAGGKPAVARAVLIPTALRTAADRYFRRSFPVIIKRLGSPPAVGRALVHQRIAGRAAWRPQSEVLIVRPLVALTPPVTVHAIIIASLTVQPAVAVASVLVQPALTVAAMTVVPAGSLPPSPPPPALPGAPTGLTALPGSVILAWTAPTGSTVTSYNVYRGAASGGETLLTSGVTGTGYTDTTALAGATYFYKVTAVNTSGEGPASNEATITLAPAAPTNLAASAAGLLNQIALTWTASSGATSYNVYRGTTPGGESSTPIATGISGTAYTDSGLIGGTTYYYTVKAVNTGGMSAASNEASATANGIVPGYSVWLNGSIGLYSDTLGTMPQTTDGGAVEFVMDQSGNHNNFVMPAGASALSDDTYKAGVCNLVGNAGALGNSTIAFNTQNFAAFFVAELLNLRPVSTGFPNTARTLLNDPSNFIKLFYDSATGAGNGQLAVADASDTYTTSLYLPTSKALLGVVGSASAAQLIVNGNSATTTALIAHTTAGLDIIADAALDSFVGGTVQHFVVYPFTLSAPQIAQMQTWAQLQGVMFSTPAVLLVEGDSISSGVGATNNRSWNKILGLGALATEYNLSEPGITMSAINTDRRALQLVTVGKINVAVLFAGTNDFAGTLATYTDVYGWYQSYGQALQAAGSLVLAVGMLPRSGNDGAGHNMETTDRQPFNAALLAGWPAFANAYADVTTLAMGQPGADVPPIYNSDGIHPTNAGYQQLAGLIGPIISNLINVPHYIYTTFAATINLGTPYSQAFTAASGIPAPTYSVTSGSLPPGLTLNSTTGIISGTPTGAAQVYSFTITATNTQGAGSQSATLTTQTPAPGTPLGQWKADAITGVTNGQDLHTQGVNVPDSSGNNHPMIADETGVVYKTNVQNGLPVLQSSGNGAGSGGFMNAAIGTVAQPYTIAAVAKRLAGTTNPFISDQSNFQAGDNAGGGTWFETAGTSINGGTSDNNFHTFVMVLNGASSALYVDGTQIASGNAGSNSLGTAFGNLILFMDLVARRNAYQIGEVLLYGSGAPTPAQLYAYLQPKWGTP